MPFVKRVAQADRLRYRELRTLQKNLGVRFRNWRLLNHALTHSSFSHEAGTHEENYERLEFLGDSILGALISEYLFHQFPFFREGQLTKLKSQIVSTSTLATLGRNLKFVNYLRLGKGERVHQGNANPLYLAGSLEAVIAGLYLDRGINVTRNFILRHFADEIRRIEEGKGKRDYKSLLQEITLGRFKVTPAYEVLSEERSQHPNKFEIAVKINGEIYGTGSGRNKKTAEQQAAREAIAKFINL